MSKRVVFIERCLAGDVLDPQIEILDAIDEWHDSKVKLPPLHDWLGMSREEYRLYAEKPWALRAILAARRSGASLIDMLRVTEGGTSLAARGVNADEFSKIQKWLRDTSRL